jgi:MoaA/NifB/PqqE/SkfB family radical SAM enzyme
MTIAPPTHILWDIAYTCPLRCTHCYSESGRRPSRQLSHEDILRVADRIIFQRPEGVGLAGGEGLEDRVRIGQRPEFPEPARV